MSRVQPIQTFTSLRFGYAFPQNRRLEFEKVLDQLDHRNPKMFGGKIDQFISKLSTRLPIGQINRLIKKVDRYIQQFDKKYKDAQTILVDETKSREESFAKFKDEVRQRRQRKIEGLSNTGEYFDRLDSMDDFKGIRSSQKRAKRNLALLEQGSTTKAELAGVKHQLESISDPDMRAAALREIDAKCTKLPDHLAESILEITKK